MMETIATKSATTTIISAVNHTEYLLCSTDTGLVRTLA
jgi:hypothetical protein